MYDTNYTCCYHLAECSEQEQTYQQDMLAMFTLSEFDDDTINNDVDMLYNKMKESDQMRECMRKAAALLLSEDERTGFNLLFSFEYLHLNISCIHSYVNDNHDSFESHVKFLMNKLTEK